MRKLYLLIAVISTLLMTASLQSCGEKSQEPQKTLEDKDRRVFLDKDNYVDASIIFTDDDFVKRLLARKWELDGMPYIYDTYNCQRLYKDNPDGIMDSVPPKIYQFYDNNKYEISGFDSDTDKYQFEYNISNKQFILTENYLTSGFYNTHTYTVVGISSECLVFDRDYAPELVEIPKGFMKFDKSKAKIRYVWRAVYY